MATQAGRVAGQVAVVTGGASGIGRAIALRLAAEGARVAIADIQRLPSEQVKAEITAAGGTAIVCQTDVSSSDTVDALFKRVHDEWGAIDILSNNAGVNAIAPGLIDTPMTADAPPMVRQVTLMRTPLGRSGSPDEIASVALFLVSDDASFVTGQVVSPNGGLLT